MSQPNKTETIKVNINEQRSLGDHAVDVVKIALGALGGIKGAELLGGRKGLTGGSGGKMF